jgi:hypothetical protein
MLHTKDFTPEELAGHVLNLLKPWGLYEELIRRKSELTGMIYEQREQAVEEYKKTVVGSR